MSDELRDRRRKIERRTNGERRKCPRRMGEVYPPPGSSEWKQIVENKIRRFMTEHMMSLSEFKMLVEGMDELE
jgi:hypothetical protein